MRYIEERWIEEQEDVRRSESELHRLNYAYYLRRLTAALRDRPNEREVHRMIATNCRRERAAHLQMSEFECDQAHGSVMDIARRLTDDSKETHR